MRKIILITALLVMSGCMSMGTKVDPNQATQFKKGVSTQSDIIAAFGEPNQRSTMADGRSAIAYINSTARPDAATFIPFVGAFVGKVEAQQTTVHFVFDADGRLAETTTDTAKVRGGMFGE